MDGLDNVIKKQRIGPFVCKVLRHDPSCIGIDVDEFGWANVEDLIKGVSKKKPMDKFILDRIVSTNDKQRLEYNHDEIMLFSC